MPRPAARFLLPLALLACTLAGCGSGRDHPTGPRASSWHGFGPGRWPDASWRPYAPSSPFNRTATRAKVHPRSVAMVAAILGFGEPRPLVANVAGRGDDYGHPTYYAQTDDPVYRLQPVYRWGGRSLAGRRIRIPARARPAGGVDGHMTVVEPDGWEYDFWQIRSKQGRTLRFSWGGRTRIDGSGVGMRAAATAAGFANLAGVVRAQELEAGRINHALFMTLPCLSDDRRFGHGVHRARGAQSSYVYPANHGGSRCHGHVGELPPMGARLRLDISDAEIDSLAIPRWRKAILRALAHYGGYLGDTGGDALGIQMESSVMYTAFGHPDPLARLGHRTGVPQYDGRYLFELASGFDWRRHLRVVLPPTRR